MHGQRIMYLRDKSILGSGLWEGDVLVQEFALDQNRFPFNPPVSDPGKGERDRLAAETERGRQQELEQKLAAETRDRERLVAEARDRERLATELEAERKKRQELEEKLASAERPPVAAPQTSKRQASLKTERRVALVIGNSTYKVSPLDNPVNDATDMAESLKKFGFQTTLLRNATLAQIRLM